MSYYSQNDEERVITEFFGTERGRFLDVGAYDGIAMSNTRRLLETGWEAVYVEPMWTTFQKLCDNCTKLASPEFILAAVAPKREIRRLWVDKTDMREWSTTINSDLKNSGSVRQPSTVSTFVPTVTMEDLFRFGPFLFVSIDAEWEDLEILNTTATKDWERTRLVCVEYRNNEEKPQMLACLDRLGFAVIHETKENLIAKNLCFQK